MAKHILLQLKIEKDADVFAASCPALPGCVSWGKSYDEAYKNIQEAVACHLEALQKLEKNRYAFLHKRGYLKELKHPSVVALIE